MTSSTSSPSRKRRVSVGEVLGVASMTFLVALAATVWASVTAHAVTGASIFLGLCTLALGWVLWLIYHAVSALAEDLPPEEIVAATGRRRKELERDKQALLKALKELEFDHQMGKVSDADFKDLSANYRARAVRVMRQLDLTDAGADYHKLIERDLRQRLAGTKKAPEAPTAAPTAEEEATAATPPPDAVVDPPADIVASGDRPQCVACNTANDADAAFCKKCGKPLQAASEDAPEASA